jgi:hypothetical protein
MKTIAAALLCAVSFATPAFTVAEVAARECQVRQDVCVLVPETDYKGKGDVRPTIKVTVCFADRDYAIITRPDGTNEWVVHLRYPRGSYDRIATVHNAQCRDQWVVAGTKVAVYVTCPEYTGWVATDAITQGGKLTMQRVKGSEWSYRPV